MHHLGGFLRETEAAGSRVKDDGPVCSQDIGCLPIHRDRAGREIPIAIGRGLSDEGQRAMNLCLIHPTKGQFSMTDGLRSQEKTKLC